MATNIGFQTHTATTLDIRLGGGAGGTFVPRADVLAACAIGPLRTYLSRLPTDTWASLFTSGKVCLTVNPTEAVNCQLDGSFVDGGAQADAAGLVGVAGASTNCLFRLTFVRSQNR
jgi:hypothetical protein